MHLAAQPPNKPKQAPQLQNSLIAASSQTNGFNLACHGDIKRPRTCEEPHILNVRAFARTEHRRTLVIRQINLRSRCCAPRIPTRIPYQVCTGFSPKQFDHIHFHDAGVLRSRFVNACVTPLTSGARAEQNHMVKPEQCWPIGFSQHTPCQLWRTTRMPHNSC